MRVTFACGVTCVGLALVGACSQHSGGSMAAPTPTLDAGADSAIDPHAPYPAPHPPVPRLANAGGPTIPSMHVVPVTFAGDPYADDIEKFLGALGASAYWKAAMIDYGVGPMIVDAPVRSTETPPAIADANTPFSGAAKWIASHLDGSTASTWPQPMPGRVYAVFVPTTTDVKNANAFHSTLSGLGDNVAYAIIGRTFRSGSGVPYQTSLTGELDRITFLASHELGEMATDPFPYVMSAWLIDPATRAAEGIGVTENGDLCEYAEPSYVRDTELGHAISRLWVPVAAAAGHDPCSPAVGGPYFNSVAVVSDDVTVSTPLGGAPTKGIKVLLGDSKSVEVDLFSDAPMDAWKVSAFDVSGKHELDVSFDRTTGQNGDKLTMTVKPLVQKPPFASVFVLASTSGARTNVTYVAVGP